MQQPNEPNWSRWLRHAREDLRYAELLRKEQGYYLTCYLAQQVAEKAIKAWLYFQGEELVLGHSIQELAARVRASDEELAKVADSCRLLDSYYIPTRYPNGLPGGIGPDIYDDTAAAQALSMASELLDFADQKIADQIDEMPS